MEKQEARRSCWKSLAEEALPPSMFDASGSLEHVVLSFPAAQCLLVERDENALPEYLDCRQPVEPTPEIRADDPPVCLVPREAVESAISS